MAEALSRQRILNEATLYIDEEGIPALQMRILAKRLGISVGSIYNYYPTKGSLIVDVIASYWERFYEPIRELRAESQGADGGELFFRLIDLLFASDDLFRTHSFVLTGNCALSEEEQKEAYNTKNFYLDDVQHTIEEILDRDARIPKNCWNDNFTKAQFARLIIRSVLVSLWVGRPDAEFVKEMACRILYTQIDSSCAIDLQIN